jgi:hypothetical protein
VDTAAEAAEAATVVVAEAVDTATVTAAVTRTVVPVRTTAKSPVDFFQRNGPESFRAVFFLGVKNPGVEGKIVQRLKVPFFTLQPRICIGDGVKSGRIQVWRFCSDFGLLGRFPK